MRKLDSRFIFGAFVLGIMLSLIVGGLLFLSPEEVSLTNRLCPPSGAHLFGCDLNGGDVFYAILHGGKISLSLSIITVLITLFVGVNIGLLTGYIGGLTDRIIMMFIDILMAFPGILLSLLVSSLMPASYITLIFAMTLTGWIGFARITRALVLSFKEREHVLSAIAIGQHPLQILRLHIFPMLIAPLLVQFTFSLSGVIIVESSLSFLGLGPQNGFLSWGGLLSQGKTVMLSAPWLTLIPGTFIMLTVMSFNFIGDFLRDYYDPRVSRSR